MQCLDKSNPQIIRNNRFQELYSVSEKPTPSRHFGSTRRAINRIQHEVLAAPLSLSLTCEVIQALQHFLLPREVQGKSVKGVVQVNFRQQDLRRCCCHGDSVTRKEWDEW